jgi:elongation factor P
MISTNQFKNGMTILIGREIFSIIEFQHHKPGKGGAIVRTKLKNIMSGAVIDKTFRAEEKVAEAFLEEKKLQYLYRADNNFHFMDQETFDDLSLTIAEMKETTKFLKEGMAVTASFYNDQIVELKLPIFVELKVEKTEPGVRGDTAKAALKPAQLETGATVQVPLFINIGDTVKIDTRTGGYAGRI